MPVINPTSDTFDLAVTQKSKDEPVVIVYTAGWCGPCKSLKPKLAKLANEWGFTLAVISAEDQPGLAAMFGIRAVPTVIVLENGLVRGRLTGDRTEESLRAYFGEFGLDQSTLRLEF
jgi:thioredoxin-like negative regulator of GroEL